MEEGWERERPPRIELDRDARVRRRVFAETISVVEETVEMLS